MGEWYKDWAHGKQLQEFGFDDAEFIEMKEIGHFPMSENYPVFGSYLKRALEIVKTKKSASVSS